MMQNACIYIESSDINQTSIRHLSLQYDLKREQRQVNWKTTVIVCIAILLGAGAAVTAIFSTEPAAERSSARKQTAMLVEVAAVEYGSFRPTITAMGTVRPEREIMLSPRVGADSWSKAKS